MDFKTQKSVRLYLHPMYSRRLVMIMRDFKLVNLELHEWPHFRQKGCSLTLLGSDGEQLNWRDSVYERVCGGYPIYTLKTNDISGAEISMKTFCTADETPVTIMRTEVSNPTNTVINASLSLFPCTADDDRYLTGLWDTGYEPYMPNMRAQCMLNSKFEMKDGILTDGYASLRTDDTNDFEDSFTGANINDFEPSNLIKLSFTLAPGETKRFSAFLGTPGCDIIRDAAHEELLARRYWDDLRSNIKIAPDTAVSRYRDIYDQMITTCLQMLAKYEGSELIFPRQGCVGRFIWAWEAAYFLTALDRVGFSEYTRPAYRTLLETWQITDEQSPDYGKIDYQNVKWANTNGSVIWCVSEHLLARRDKAAYDEFMPYLMRAVQWIENKRAASVSPDMPRLFPSAQASDWGEVGQHYTYTDSVNLMGYRSLLRVMESYDDERLCDMRAHYDDYKCAFDDAVASLVDGHEDDEDYMPTHILGKSFAEVRTHCYYSDGISYLPMCGSADPSGRLFRFMERYCERHGLFENNFRGRITNLDWGMAGVYGDTYYTNVPETSWFYAYMQRGERDKAWEMLESTLRFNLTDEYTTSERYTPLDVWYAPWQPNASACGRVISMLLDYFGEKKL
ncbi:MAG: hypothetical protein WCQ72_06440 [Eubacteriales bacterium]